MVSDERKAMLRRRIADRLPAAHIVTALALHAQRALMTAAVAVAANAVERNALPLPHARTLTGRVTALARDFLMPAQKRKASLRVIYRFVGRGGNCDQ